MRFDFIRREKKAYPVTVLCKVMEVSRSRFYEYLHSLERSDDPDEVAFKARIRAVFKEHRGKYGSRRVTKQLKDDGHQIGRYKVRRLMRDLGLKATIDRATPIQNIYSERNPVWQASWWRAHCNRKPIFTDG